MKLKRILSLFVTLALLAGLFVHPAFADSGQINPDLSDYLFDMGQPTSITINGTTMWAHFDRGQLIYGFPSGVTGGTQGYAQGWKTAPPVNGQDWETANVDDALQVLSSYTNSTNWQKGIQNSLPTSGEYQGQEPRYLGYAYEPNGQPVEVSNINFPIDSSTMSAPAQCVMIKTPWSSVSADPDYGHGSGWPALSTIDQLHWGLIRGTITTCYKQFGFTSPTDGFLYNPAFSDANGDLGPNNMMNYFEMLVMPEPGSPGTVRFWHNDSNGSGPYYKDIMITWPDGELPDYYVTNLTPFSGTQTSPTTTVDGQAAAVYNQSGAQNTYTGSVTFGLTGDPANQTNSDEATQQLLNLMGLNNGLAPYSGEDPYYAPIAICINAQNSFAGVGTTEVTPDQPVPANENCGGPNEGIILGDSDRQMTPGQPYTVNFTWSVPQGFSGTSMSIGAGINDGNNDIFNQATDIIPDDITNGYADPYEVDLTNNYTSALDLSNNTGGNKTATGVLVVGATQPELVVTPATATINGGGTQQYDATYYPNGQSQGNSQVVTTQSAWLTGGSSIAIIGTGNGLATGVSAGSTGITARYTPPAGSALNGTASLTVTVPQPTPSNGYTATLSFAAVNQPEIKTITGQEIGGTLHRKANTAMWTDTVTATLSVPQPDVSPYVPAGGVVTGVTWSISNVTLIYPAQNPDYTFGNPVEPTTTTSTSMTPSGHEATASFEENWSEDGLNGGAGIHDTLTNSTIAATPVSYPISATFTLSGTVSGYVPTRESDGNGGTTIVDVPFTNQFTLPGSAAQDLLVDGTGAVPMTSAGQNYMVGDLSNPGGAGGDTSQ